MDNNNFFNLLFDPGEITCFSPDLFTTAAYPVSANNRFSDCAFFCINPLAAEDRKPTSTKHHKSIPRKADANISSLRNILIESDKMSLDEQQTYFDTIGLPRSTITFSGSKSLHFIISLETPLGSEKEYRALVKRVYQACGGKEIVDTACGNPSRFSRFPGAFRAEKGKTQELLYVGSRIKNEDLETWLRSRGVMLEVKKDPIADNTYIYQPLGLNSFTQNFVMFGRYREGEFNNTLFMSGLDLARNKYSFDKAVALIEKGLREPLDINSLKSLRKAYSYV